MFDDMYKGASTSGGRVDTRALAPPYRGGGDPDFMKMLAALLSNRAGAMPVPAQRPNLPGVPPVGGRSPDILADTPVAQMPATPAMNPQGPPPVPAQRPVGGASPMGASEPMGMMASMPAVASPAAQGKPAGSGMPLGYGSMMAGEAGVMPGEGGAEASYSMDELKAMLARLLGR